MCRLIVMIVYFFVFFIASGQDIAMVGNWGHVSNKALALEDNTLVMAGGSFQVFSLAESDHPRFQSALSLSQLNMQPDMVIRNGIAWTVEHGGLVAIDLSDPENPFVLSRTPLVGGNSFRLDVCGSLAIVAHTSPDTLFDGRDIHVLDVSNPEEPRILSSTGSVSRIRDVIIKGDYAYISCATSLHQGELMALSLADPYHPVLAEPITTGDIRQLEVCSTGLAGVTEAEIVKISLASPSSPSVTGSHRLLSYSGRLTLTVVGDTAFVGRDPSDFDDAGGISEFDLSGIAPTLTREFLASASGSGVGYRSLVTGANLHCYAVRIYHGVLLSESELVTLDLEEQDPTILHALPAEGFAYDPVVSENGLHVNVAGGWMTFDITKPDNIQLTGVGGEDDVPFSVSARNMQIKEASEGENSATLGTLKVEGGPFVSMYDVADPENPEFLGQFTGGVEPGIHVAADDKAFYFTNCNYQTVTSWLPIIDQERTPIPHIAQEGSVWETRIAYCNSGSELAMSMVRRTPREQIADHAWLKLHYIEPFASRSSLLTWNTGCGYAFDQRALLSKKLVFINLEADGGGMAEFWLDDSPETELELVLPHYHAAYLTWMGLAVMNTEETEGDATLRVFDAQGVELDSVSVTIPSEDRMVGYVEDYFPSVSFVDAARIRVDSDHLLAGLTISGTGNRQLLYTPAVTADQSETLFIPHIANEVDYWSSALVVDNTTDTDRTITIKTYDNASPSLPGAHLIPAGTQRVLTLNGGSSEATPDCGVVTGAGNGVIVREVFISHPENGTAEFLLSGETGDKLQFAFPWYADEDVDLTWRGLALMNTGSLDVSVHVRAYNSAGYLLNQSDHVIPARNRFVGYMDELVPDVSPANVAMILVEADEPGSQLCGINISGHENERLLFTPARVFEEVPEE